jgi:formylglycine-generating enzyme
MKVIPFLFSVLLAAGPAWSQKAPGAVLSVTKVQPLCCASNIPSRYGVSSAPLPADSAAVPGSRAGMLYIKGGTFQMGGDNGEAGEDEYPKHAVTVRGFWMDATEVTMPSLPPS